MINKVSIALNTKVYSTFRNLVNTIPNALGEYVCFVDVDDISLAGGC